MYANWFDTVYFGELTQIAPVLRGQAKAVVVKERAEDEDVEYIALKQRDMVWHKDVGGCSSWVTRPLDQADQSITMKRRGEMICCIRIFRLNSGYELYFPSGDILISRYSSM